MLFRLAGKSKAINVIVDRLFYTPIGSMMISAVFGVAIAFLFQKVCKGDSCITIEPPPMEELENTVYEFNNQCYKYKPKSIKCDTAS
jgi:hypothetical protein